MTLATEILYGSMERVKRAILSVEHLNFIDEYGYTPLIEAAIANNVEKAQLLLDHGAEINKQDLVGGTALQWAVENNNFELCELLLNHGADPNLANFSSQTPLVKTLLRQQNDLKQLLREYDADLTYSQDFINAKLLGHMFELMSTVDIVDPQGRFTELNFEGFFLEFTVDAIKRSLMDFQYNFAARHFRSIYTTLQTINEALTRTAKLVNFQQYLVDIKKHKPLIESLLSQEPLIAPISQEGHALTLVRHGSLLAICDRAKYGEQEDEVTIYYMNKRSKLNYELLCQLLYKVNPLELYHKVLPLELGMQPVATLPIHSQLAGNCTWANVEASIPILYFMLTLNDRSYQHNLSDTLENSLQLFYDWREWEKDRSLHRCITDFYTASPARKASKAAILAAILFQRCHVDDPKSIERAMKIIPVLKTPGYEYTVQNYLEVYHHQKKTSGGKNLKRLLELHDIIGI